MGALGKKMSTKEPLALAVQAMTGWEQRGGVVGKVEYLPGLQNEAADQLSRWRRKGIQGFNPGRECRISLKEVLDVCPVVPMERLEPVDA